MFVILSGYFFHQRGGVVDNVYSSFKTLAVPYLKTGLFCLVFSYTFYDDTFTKQLLYGLFIGNCGNVFSYYTTFPLQGGPMWFLLSLFWCRVTYDIISRRTSRKITGILSFVIFLGAYVIGAKIVTIPLGFGAGLTMLPFYFIGHLLHEYPQKKVFVLYMIPIWLYAVATSYLNMAQFIYGHTPVAFMGGVSGTLVIWNVCKHIKGVFAKLLSYIGRHTLTILCCHSIIYNLRVPLLQSAHIKSPEGLIDDIVFVGGSVLVSGLFLLVKFFNYKIHHRYESF